MKQVKVNKSNTVKKELKPFFAPGSRTPVTQEELEKRKRRIVRAEALGLNITRVTSEMNIDEEYENPVTIQHRPNHLLMRSYDSDSSGQKSHCEAIFHGFLPRNCEGTEQLQNPYTVEAIRYILNDMDVPEELKQKMQEFDRHHIKDLQTVKENT